MATAPAGRAGYATPTGPAALAGRTITWLEHWPAGVVQLAARLWMASIFFKSGLLKIQNFRSAEFLFSEVHPVPLLPPMVAAVLATGFELICPVLLVLGLLTRLAALPMLAMAMVIQFAVGLNDPAFYQNEHYYWMMLLGFIIAKGPGPISLDRQWLTPRYGVPT